MVWDIHKTRSLMRKKFNKSLQHRHTKYAFFYCKYMKLHLLAEWFHTIGNWTNWYKYEKKLWVVRINMVTLFTSNDKLTFKAISEPNIVFTTLVTASASLYCSVENFASLPALCSAYAFIPCFTKDWTPVGESATHFSPLCFFGNSYNQVLTANTYKIKDTTKYKNFSPLVHTNLVFI